MMGGEGIIVAALPSPQGGIPPAKVSRPSLRGVLDRERLFCALDTARDSGTAIWIAGPAGAGKTTLAASYLQSRDLSQVWCRVDEGDADVAAFFYYLGLAGQASSPRKRKPLPLLTAEYTPGLPTFARRYFRDLYARLTAPFAVVFDNYHSLPHSSPVHLAVRIAVEEMPEGGCLMVIGRDPPHEEFATFLAGRNMTVLGAETLNLTLDETKGIVAAWGHAGVPDGEIRVIHEMTHGWIAGVFLLREQFSSMTKGFLPTGMAPRRVVFDYLAAEVFRKMPSDVQEFLLKTALFPEMSVDMARRLTGLAGAGEILRDLNQRNYFTERHHIRVDTYGYHSLFREFLLSQAPTRLGADGFVQAQVDAAEILDSVGQVEAAFDLFSDTGRSDQMAKLVAIHAPAFMAQGRHVTLENWFQALPGDLVDGNPDLLFWRGVNQVPLSPPTARGYLEASFRKHRTDGNRLGMLLGLSSIIDTFLYEWGDFRPLDRWISELDEVLAGFSDWPSPELEARVGTGAFLALWSRQPQHPQLRAWEDRLEALIFGIEDPDQRIMIGARLAQYCTMTGEFAKGERLLNSLRSSVKAQTTSPLSLVTWWFVKAIYGWLYAVPGKCAECVEQGLRISRETGVHVCDYLLLSQRVYGSLTEGNTGEAQKDLDRMADRLVESRFLDAALYHYLYSWYAILRDDVPVALEHLKTSLRNVTHAGVPFVEGLVRVAMAQMWHETAAHREAGEELRRASKIAAGMGSSHLKYMCLVAAANFELERGNEKQGLDSLRKAFEVGRRSQYINFPWWRSSVMGRLTAKAIESGIEVDYAKNLAKRRGLRPELRTAGQKAWPWPVKIYMLGQFKILLEDQEIRFSRKAREKPLQLFKALIALGGDQVPERRLADLLWPDSEGDAAHHTLGITLYRLRRLLGQRPAIKRVGRTLTIVRDECWVDVWEFQRLLELADEARASAGRDGYCRLAREAIETYRGQFLPNEANEPWALPVQERLREEFIGSACALGAHLEGRGEWSEAIAVFQDALAKEPLAEPLWQQILRLLVSRGLMAEARRMYARYRETLSAETGTDPSFRLEDFARAMQV